MPLMRPARRAIGQLKGGPRGDIAVFDASKSKSYRAVIEAGVEDTILVLRGGKTMYGDSELLTEIGDKDCEDLPVCKVTEEGVRREGRGRGRDARRSPDRGGRGISALLLQGPEPQNEPSCEPKRGATGERRRPPSTTVSRAATRTATV